MYFEAKAIELSTGMTVHLSGEWQNRETMEHELADSGLILTWYIRIR